MNTRNINSNKIQYSVIKPKTCQNMEETSVKMDKIVIEHCVEENEVFLSTNNEEEHKNNIEPVITTELECGGPGTSSDQGNIKNNNNNNNNNLNKNNNNKKVNNRRRKRSYRRKNNLKNPKNCFKNNTKCDKQNPRFVGRDNERKKLYFKESRRFVPYNTNEFLMEDHFPKLSPNFIYSPSFRPSISMEDSPRVYSVKSLDDTNYDYLTKEFSSDYEKIRTETLHELNKDELIEEYLKLEKQIEQSMKVKEDTIRRQNVVIFGRFKYSNFLNFTELPTTCFLKI